MIFSHLLVDIWRESYKGKEAEVMFLDTDFLKNDEMQLILEKAVEGNVETQKCIFKFIL